MIIVLKNVRVVVLFYIPAIRHEFIFSFPSKVRITFIVYSFCVILEDITSQVNFVPKNESLLSLTLCGPAASLLAFGF
jgi:hypothetical protein